MIGYLKVNNQQKFGGTFFQLGPRPVSVVCNLNITTSRIDIGQKGHQNSPPPPIPSLFLSVLHQNKALHNFCKRGQCSDHTEYALTSDYNNFPNDLCDSKNALGLNPWPWEWVCNVLITTIFPTGEWGSSLARQKFAPYSLPTYTSKNFPIYQIFILPYQRFIPLPPPSH